MKDELRLTKLESPIRPTSQSLPLPTRVTTGTTTDVPDSTIEHGSVTNPPLPPQLVVMELLLVDVLLLLLVLLLAACDRIVAAAS